MEKVDRNKMTLQEKIEYIDMTYPVAKFDGPGKLFTLLRRMKIESEWEIPVSGRYGFSDETKKGERTSEDDAEEWDTYYEMLSDELLKHYPDLWQSLFGI